MSTDPLEKIVKVDPDFQYDENTEKVHKLWDDSWHIEGQNLQQNYNKTRDAEMNTRIEEIFSKTKTFYCSGKGVIVLIVSIVLCVITETLSAEGLFFWNIVLLIIVLGYYHVTSRTEVQPEWNEAWEEMEDL
jgi:hypothetical protein